MTSPLVVRSGDRFKMGLWCQRQHSNRLAGRQATFCGEIVSGRGCTAESALLSEKAGAIKSVLAQISPHPHADSQASPPSVALPSASSASLDPRCSAPPTDTTLHKSGLPLSSEAFRNSGTAALAHRRRTPSGIRSWRKDAARGEPIENRYLGTAMTRLPCSPSPFPTPVVAMT
jgi:hypothetical protein